MIEASLVALTLLSWIVVVVLHLAQRRLLANRRTRPSDLGPPVSILKPLKGDDPGLEDNLRSFFRLDYPDYELIFGVADPGDPGIAVARRVAAKYPEIPVRFVADGRQVGPNPKVNNLANILERARHELILISDSNVRVGPGHLAEMVATLHKPGVGVVTAPIRGVACSGIFAALEALQLNTFVMAGVAGVTLVAGRPCAVGKSMLLRRSDLARIGGFVDLARFLAEDQVSADRIAALGLEAAVASAPVDNVLGRVTLGGFAGRHLRWARIRRHTSLPAYLAEVLTNPVAPAVLGLAAAPGWPAAALLGGTVLLLSVLAAGAERRLGIRRSKLRYPMLELLRGLMLTLLWPVPFVSSTVSWRGHRFRLGQGTLLTPLDGDDWMSGDALTAEEATV
jgi:ceramide glucosyltransferase